MRGISMLIKQGVVPVMGGPVRLVGGDPTTPKGVTLILGAGWTQKSNDQFVFDVPPGDNFTSMQFDGLQIGAQYQMSLVATASAGYGGMVLRPGDFADDVPIQADGAYNFTFTAQNSNGITRFAPVDVTGVTRITFSLLKLVAL